MNSIGPWCATYFLCLLAAGYGVMALHRNLSRIERFGFAACAGPGILGLVLLAFSFAGFKPSRAEVLTIGILGAIAAIAGFITRKKLDARPQFPRPPIWLRIIAGLAIAYGLCSVAYDAAVYPTFAWDAFSVWQLKAKVLTLEPMNPPPAYFHDNAVRYSELRYPLLVPMISAGVHAMTGDITDELGNTPYLLMYFGLVAAIYGCARRNSGPTIALCVCALLSTVPALLDMAVSGMADFALTAFYACSIICILRWQQENKIIDAIFAAFFTLAMAWTKNEGAMMALINFLVLLVFIPRPLARRNILAAIAFALTLVLLFRIPYRIFLPGPEFAVPDYPSLMTPSRMIANISRVEPILSAMGNEFTTKLDWGLFWFVVAAVALLDFKRIFRRPYLAFWALLVLQWLSYILPYLVTTLDYQSLFPVTLPRLFPHLLPAAAILAALHGRNLISDSEKIVDRNLLPEA